MGAGGSGGTGSSYPSANGLSGSDSFFVRSVAGGGAGLFSSPGNLLQSVPGGSGGGARPASGSGAASTAVAPGVGNAGGSSSGNGGGGGGGAGSPGTTGTTSLSGSGGNGLQNSITGVSTYYAGGGAGGNFAPTGGSIGSGGSGIGGTSSYTGTAGSGVNNTGSGGAGGSYNTSTVPYNGGNGAQGIVILRWLTTDAGYTVSGANPTQTIDGAYTVLSFTAVVTSTITFNFTSTTKITSPLVDFNSGTEDGLKLPSGDDANQPTGVQGMIRNNTNSGMSSYNGSDWISLEATESPDVVYPTSLKMYLDASDTTSYPGTGTTWFDLTSNANNGAISGASFSSLDGGYFSFDGSNDFVNTGSSTTKALPMSVAMWINPGSSFSPRGVIYSNYDGGTTNGFYIRLETSGKFQIDAYIKPAGTYYRTLLNQTGSALPTNQWSQCIFTFDTSYVTAYLNGVLDAQVATNSQGIGFTSSFDTLLARRAGGDYFSGEISQARVYDVTLTQAEITTLYNEGR